MNEIDTNDIKTILTDISKKIIIPKFKNLKDNEIWIKNQNDLVTIVDIQVEDELIKNLNNLLPDSLFVGEEMYSKNPKIVKNYLQKSYCWTIDPIDGTKNFAKGKEKFAIMLALTYEKKILQSWIYKPISEDIISAKFENGSFYNDKKIKIIDDTPINNSVGSISSKYWEDNDFLKIKRLKNIFKEINSYGCIGFEYVDLSLNKRNFAILSKLSPWDHIPGILILREAGGFDSYFDQGNYQHYLNKKNLIVSSNKNLGKKILSSLKE